MTWSNAAQAAAVAQGKEADDNPDGWSSLLSVAAPLPTGYVSVILHHGLIHPQRQRPVPFGGGLL